MLYLQKLIIASIGIFISFFLLYSQAQAADTTVSGTISLPGSVSAYATNQDLHVYLYHDWNGNWYEAITACQSLELNAGTTSSSFNCMVPNLTGPVALKIYAWNLDGIYDENFYHSNGTEWSDSKAEQLTSGASHSDIDVILLPAIIVEGELQTPGDMTFTTDRNFSIYWRYYEDNSWRWGNGDWPRLNASSTSISYSLRVPAHIGNIIISYNWQDTPEPSFVTAGYYHEFLGTQYNIDDALPITSLAGDVNGINMILLQGLPVTGLISLPTGETNSDGMQVRIRAIPANDWSEVASTDIVIPAGDTSAPYTLYVPPSDNIEISYTDVTDTDRAYIKTGYYAGSSTSFRWNYAADFPPESPPVSVDLTLIPGYTVSGTISVPVGVASSEIRGNISVEFWAPGSMWTTNLSEYYSISNGSSSSGYTVTIPTNSSRISVNYSIWSVSEYISSGYYSDGETTWDYSQRTTLSGGSDHPDIHLTLIPGATISGNIGLPGGLLASGNFNASTNAYLFDTFTQNWDQIAWGSAAISSGTNSAPYTLTVPAGIEDIVVSYSLWDSSSEYIRNGYYNSTTTTSNVDLATPVSTSTDQPDVNMTFVKYNSITGQISLTGGELASKDTWISLGALTQPDGDYHSTDKGLWSYHTTDRWFSTWVLIPEGQNSVDYTVNVAEDIGDISIEYSLTASDTDYVKHGFYADDSGENVTGFFAYADPFEAVNNYPGTNMTMPHGFLVEGTVTLGEPAKRGERVEIGLRPIATGIDNFYDTTLFIPWQATSIDYSYRALFDSHAVVGMKTGGKNGYLPELYFKTSAETVRELAQATILTSGGPLPTNINFNLYSWTGDVNLDTYVNLTDTILSLQTTSSFTGLSVFKEGDATGDSRIGVEDAIYALQEEAGMFEPVPCITNDTCGDNQFCQKDSCMDLYGTCVQTPGSGDCIWSSTETVCGCDGETYRNACEAAIAGTNVDISEYSCEPPTED